MRQLWAVTDEACFSVPRKALVLQQPLSGRPQPCADNHEPYSQSNAWPTSNAPLHDLRRDGDAVSISATQGATGLDVLQEMSWQILDGEADSGGNVEAACQAASRDGNAVRDVSEADISGTARTPPLLFAAVFERWAYEATRPQAMPSLQNSDDTEAQSGGSGMVLQKVRNNGSHQAAIGAFA